MNILALEAADFALTMARLKDDVIVDTFEHPQAYNIESILLPQALEMLKKNGLNFHDLQAIVTTAGPGSFTGIRIAMAACQGLAMAIPCPALAFNAFDWVTDWARKTHNISSSQKILVALESKRAELFLRLEGSEPLNCSPSDILQNLPKETILVGSGAYAFGENSQFERIIPDMPKAGDLGIYASEQFKKHGAETFPCIPFYMRPADVHGKKQ